MLRIPDKHDFRIDTVIDTRHRTAGEKAVPVTGIGLVEKRHDLSVQCHPCLVVFHDQIAVVVELAVIVQPHVHIESVIDGKHLHCGIIDDLPVFFRKLQHTPAVHLRGFQQAQVCTIGFVVGFVIAGISIEPLKAAVFAGSCVILGIGKTGNRDLSTCHNIGKLLQKRRICIIIPQSLIHLLQHIQCGQIIIWEQNG